MTLIVIGYYVFLVTALVFYIVACRKLSWKHYGFSMGFLTAATILALGAGLFVTAILDAIIMIVWSVLFKVLT